MDANTIQELNEVRKAMGLKPLPVPNAAPAAPKGSPPDDTEEVASTIETREAAAGENYRKILEAEKAKRDREAKIAAIKKERDRAQRLAILKGQGLGDLDDEGDGDAKSWLKSIKKKQKKIAESRRQQEEADAAAAAAREAAEYSSKDLAGVKVGHDMSALLDGDDQILTLKDSAVLGEDDEGDELENLSLREQEKLSEKLNLKKKKPVYDPNDVDDTGEHSILAQYDEEINGKKKKTFNLDGKGTISDIADILEAPAQRKKMLQNLDVDIMQDAPVSDYLDPSEIKVKKPKKKKKSKSTRQRDDEDALFPGDQVPAADEAMDIDPAPTARKRKTIDDTFVDDEDLQASLSIQRRQALKRQKRVRPVDLAKQLRAEAAQDSQNDDQEADRGGLVLDETSEFLSAINKPAEDEGSRPRKKSKSRDPVTAMDDEDSDEEMGNTPHIREASTGRDVSAAPEELATTGVDEEKYVAQGMGATLSLLKERKIIDEDNSGAEKNEHFRRRELFLAEQARLIAQVDEDAKRQRERDRKSDHLDRMNAREREEYARRQNAEREFKLSNIRAQLLKKHKFNVELKYVDEQGRHLNQKEAFKELSHQFHGKTSGKGKTDKKLSKIGQEKSRIAKSIFDASSEAGISSATAQQTKKQKAAGVRLA
ncbi:U4/U6.U5 tri-snRNP-associated protein snu66 [Diaporthe helianthi]|uniref:U4/U6.U5 tri-snRNP-associated protein snu66 n=1 Tax=Diaporthe helianthi TaxID=158607 RepID=A0A2P5I0C3_DIAHE|nr:U4/U6.U5 tri-snRNP-associated protein snu66 [Diaporthe helianthi]